MQHNYLIQNATIVNEGSRFQAHLVVSDGLIQAIIPQGIEIPESVQHFEALDASGLFLLPGMIDDQVHFREPGLTYKGDIFSESRAAVAGGITSFMEMPNTIPNTLTNALLEDKFAIADEKSLANYSFYLGASNDNLDEIRKMNPKTVCGVKVFMGSSTGNMLVDQPKALEGIFAESPALVAVHCEDEPTVRKNMAHYRSLYPQAAPPSVHPLIRSARACFLSTSKAVELATRYHTRLHVLHLSTADEMSLFSNKLPLAEKKITAEVCVHHLWFDDRDYEEKGNFIKWNPAIKTVNDKQALWQALADGRLDVVATDHAPHALVEKLKPYYESPSGGPLVQHALPAMLDFYHQGLLTLEEIVNKTAHNPAIAFQIHKRGFIRQGYYADFVLVDLDHPWKVSNENIRYKCGWSPFEGHSFRSAITHTFVNGALVYANGKIIEAASAMRLEFDR
ncbi:MAG: dihydroorotase [Bacteroidales bacterium]|nr:dihydroorotase [Bacteroidales bacterium]